MADRLNLLRLLEVYAANWALLLGSRNLTLMARVREDFEAICDLQRNALPFAASEMAELLFAHEALANAVEGGVSCAQIQSLHLIQQDALNALHALV